MTEVKDVSIRTYENKLNQRPESLIFSRLADCYRKRGDIQQAIDVCSQGLARHPESITGRVILGRCYLEQEKYKEALIEFTKVIEQDSRNQVALKMVADVYARQDMKEKAGDIYAYLLTMDPENQSIINAATMYHGAGLTSICQIFGLNAPQPEQGFSATGSDNVSSNDIFIGNEKPTLADNASQDSMEDFGQTMRLDAEELKHEINPPVSDIMEDFGRTMRLDAEELNHETASEESPGQANSQLVSEELAPPSLSREPAAEEIPPNLTASITDSVTGDDISARMSKMFEDESPVSALVQEQGHQASEPIDDHLDESVNKFSGEQIETAKISESAPEVSGSDISLRIDQLFSTPAQEEISANVIPEPAYSPEKLEEKQENVSGEDIMTRMSEMFEKTDESASEQSDITEVIGQISDAVHDEEALSNVLKEMEAPVDIQASASTAASINAESLQEEAVSGDDIALRLQTIFEEESASSEPLTPLSDASSFDKEIGIVIDSPAADTGFPTEVEMQKNESAIPAETFDSQILENVESSISETLTFDESPESLEASALEATVIQEITNNDREPMIKQTTVDLQEEKEAASSFTPIDAAKEPSIDEVDESIDEAQLEHGPEMSGDDVRTRLDEIFPDALISEETLAVSDELPDGDKNDESPNRDFYTMSGENALLSSSDESLLDKLDAVELEVPEAPEAPAQASPPIESELFESNDEIDDAEFPKKAVIANAPKKKSDNPDETNSLNSIPDHVLTPTLADIYFQQGQPHLAVQIYSRLLQKDPDNEKIIKRLEKIKAFIAENPQTTPEAAPAPVKRPQSSAIQQTAQPASSKSRGAKKALTMPKPLAGVRIKKKKKK
jgi:tetratricopeptide (TPR) repeat protein